MPIYVRTYNTSIYGCHKGEIRHINNLDYFLQIFDILSWWQYWKLSLEINYSINEPMILLMQHLTL